MKRIGYVYIVKSNGLYKIGCAWNLENRLRQLRTAAPYLEEIHSIRTYKNRYIEKLLHMHFNRKRVIGEWFDLDEADLDFIATVDAEGTQLSEMDFLLRYSKAMTEGKRTYREIGRRVNALGAFLDALESLPKVDAA